MPLAGYVCPPGAPTHGQRNTIEHCLGVCPHPCVSPPLLAANFKADQDNHHQGAYISASMLSDGTSCARRVVYERTYPFYDYPINRYYSFRGTHAHSIIERAADVVADYGWIQELRMAVPLVYPEVARPIFDAHGGFTGDFDPTEPLVLTLGGTADAYKCTTRTELHDYKTMADIKAETFAKAGKIEEKWIWQLNIYRWLIAHTAIPPDVKARYRLRGTHFRPPSRLVIQGIAMQHMPRTGAAVQMKKGKWDKAIYDVPQIPVYPLEKIEAYIRPRALAWYRYLVLGTLPPVVGDESKWLCRFCAFNGELIDGERCHPTQERAGTDLVVLED